MTKSELKKFLVAWNANNTLYRQYFKNNRLHFPEPLQKNIILTLYDNKLVLDQGSPYDFKGNVELKSSTKYGGGCTPFSANQSACSRIIYVEIADHFDVYELNGNDVNAINNLIIGGTTNISLKQYKPNAKKTRIV